MKPILFPEGQKTFNTNGMGRLSDAISCKVTEERNGQYELHMEYPIDGQLIEELRYSRIIYATPADGKSPQPFRIYRITKPLSGVVEIDAEHISYHMSHIPVLPFEAVGMDPAFEGLKNNSAEENPFTIEKEGAFGTALANSFKVAEPNNLRALLFGSEGSVIDTFGGEWEFDHFRAILHKERGKDRGVTIRYGKNLTDLKQEENIQNTYTGICPYWKGLNEDGTEQIVYLPEKVLHSTSASNYPYQRTKVVDFSSEFQESPTAVELREKGEKYIKDNDIGTPTVSLDVSFIALHETQEYADMTRIYHINLCDTVTVLFPALNVSTKAKVVKTVYDVLLDRYESITIGAVQAYLSAALAASQEKAVEKAVAISNSSANADYVTKTTFNALSGAVGNAQRDIYHLQDFEEAITGVGGGYVVITIDENKQTDCLYILIDSPVLSAAKKVYRWNEEGLSYTAGGIEKGSWVNIAGSDGKLSAGFLKGIITDVLGKNSWNLESGVFSLSDETTFGGKTLEENVNSLLPDVDGTVQDALTSYDEGLNQEAVLSKLQNGDAGFYLSEDGLLHMLPERVVSDGANITICYLPTTILDGKVTSYREVKVVNGIIYIPEENNTDTGGEETTPGTGEGETVPETGSEKTTPDTGTDEGGVTNGEY